MRVLYEYFSGWGGCVLNSNSFLMSIVSHRFTQSLPMHVVPRSRILLEQLILTVVVKKFLVFIELEVSLQCSHNGSPLFLILSHINPVHALPVYYLKIYFNIILSSTPAWVLQVVSSRQVFLPILYMYFSSPLHATFSAHLTLFGLITLMILGEA